MKATKAILAIMIVAMMVIVPLSVADVDAGKTPAKDAENGCYIVNNETMTDQSKIMAVMEAMEEVPYLLDILKKSTKYLNQDILNYTGWGDTLKMTSMSITTYENDRYDTLTGMTDDRGLSSKVIVGTFEFTLVTTAAGKFFKEATDAADGDLLKEANKTFGDAKLGEKIDCKLELTIKDVEKRTSTYEEAQDLFVTKKYAIESLFLVNSKASYLISTDKDAVNVEYDYKEIQNITSNYDCTVSKDAAAPTTCNYTQSASDDIYDYVLKGKIGDKECSSSSIEKELKDEANKFADENTSKKTTTEATATYDDISPVDVTLSDSQITAFSANGFTGSNDVSKAKANFNAVYDELRIKSSGDSGIPVWVWIVIAIVVILVIVGIVVWLKKSGRI